MILIILYITGFLVNASLAVWIQLREEGYLLVEDLPWIFFCSVFSWLGVLGLSIVHFGNVVIYSKKQNKRKN